MSEAIMRTDSPNCTVEDWENVLMNLSFCCDMQMQHESYINSSGRWWWW